MWKTALLSWLLILTIQPPAPAAPNELPVNLEIVTADGQPVADATVIFCREAQPLNLLPAAILAQGKSNTQGKFQAPLTFDQDHPFFSFTIIAHSPQSGIGFTSLTGLNSSDLPPSTKIVLQPTTSAKLRLLNPDGSPAANLKLYLRGCLIQNKNTSVRGQDSHFFPLLPDNLWQTQTDAQGHCQLPNLPANSRIYLNHDNPTLAQPNDRNQPFKWLDTASEIPLQLTPASTITGQILTPDGTPVPGAAASIIENRRPYVTGYGTSAFTDSQGRFTIPQVPASDYKLTLHIPRTHRDQWIGPQQLEIKTTPGQTLTLAPDQLPLTKVAIVTARVLDSQTGKEILPPFLTHLPAGSHQIYFRSRQIMPPGYQPLPSNTTIPVTLKAGERLTIDFKLTPADPATLISGTVFDPTGKPHPSASVVLVSLWSREFSAPITTDANGQFSISPPKDSTNFKLYAVGNHNTLTDLITTTPGTHTKLHLKSDGFPSIQGQVTDDLNQPVKNATLQWDREGFAPLFIGPQVTAQTDHQGRFIFPRLWNNETYRLSCQAEGHGSAYQKDIQPKNGETITLNFTLLRATETLSGIVLDSTGQPVPKAYVRASGKHQANNGMQTDDQGRFHLKQIVSGPLTLEYGVANETLNARATKKVTAGQQDLQLILPEVKGNLSGIIVDPSGKPLPNTTLWSDGRTLKGSDNGQFQLKGIKPGWHDLDITASDGDRGSRTKRYRIKTGMTNLRLVLPDQQPAAEPITEEAPNMIGQPAPELQISLWLTPIPTPISKTTTPKVRIIDFWNTQCAPCIATFPKIQTFLTQNPHPDLEFIALHPPNPEQEVREFFQARPTLTFPVAISAEDSHNSINYGIRGNPTYVVIDKTGKIISHNHDWDQTTQAALQALK